MQNLKANNSIDVYWNRIESPLRLYEKHLRAKYFFHCRNSAGDIIFDLFNSIQLKSFEISHFSCIFSAPHSPSPSSILFTPAPKSILYLNLTWYSVFHKIFFLPLSSALNFPDNLLLCWIYLLIYSPFYDYEMN